jgi:putative ABC transport system substrate-binding protein
MIARRTFLTAAAAAALFASTRARSKVEVGPEGDGPAEIAIIPRVALVASSGPLTAISSRGDARWAALLQELVRLGYVEGETVTIRRWSTGGRRGTGSIARRVVDSRPDVIVAQGSRLTRSLGSRNTIIPIINIGSFRPDSNLVASLERPGGNVTGFTPTPVGEIFAKQVELLHDAAPTTSHVAWLGPKHYWDHPLTASTRSAAEKLGLALVPMRIDYPIGNSTIERAFRELANQELDALFVSPAADLYRHRETVVALAASASLPAISLQREYAELGLLMSYVTDEAARYRDAAGYVDRILRGTNPAYLPVQQATKFDFIVNLKTAREIGITIPPKIMTAATEFIG